jgi:hypothetical protein
MATVQQRPFTPVRPPRVRPIAKRMLSLTSLSALEKCQRREHELARRNRLIFSAGLGMIVVTLAALQLVAMALWHIADPRSHPPINRKALLEVASTLLLLTLLVAVFIRKPSRADFANQIIESGNRPSGGNDNPLVRWVMILILLGLLYGEFLLIDALKAMWVNFRLRNVDRHRSAVILAMLLQHPTGVDPRLLLLHGESPLHLRQVIAYLVINEWADISRHGDRLTLVSPARRALREYSVHG